MRKKNSNLHGSEVIYILVSKTKHSFFIAQGTEKTLRETYRHHIKLHRVGSENFINSLSPERPCLFILERVDSEDECNLLLVWLRILRENGFESFNHPELIEQSEHLYYDNREAYKKRKHTDLSEILSCKNCLVPTYKKETCARYLPSSESNATPIISRDERNRTKEIRIRVTEEEYTAICKQAKIQKMQIGPYIRTVAKNPIILKFDYSIISEHAKELAEIRTSINRLIYTIDAANYYLPKEIATIVSLMDAAFKSENQLLATMRKIREKGNRLLKEYFK